MRALLTIMDPLFHGVSHDVTQRHKARGAAAAGAIPAAHPLSAGVHSGTNMSGTSAAHAIAGVVGDPSEDAVSMWGGHVRRSRQGQTRGQRSRRTTGRSRRTRVRRHTTVPLYVVPYCPEPWNSSEDTDDGVTTRPPSTATLAGSLSFDT